MPVSASQKGERTKDQIAGDPVRCDNQAAGFNGIFDEDLAVGGTCKTGNELGISHAGIHLRVPPEDGGYDHRNPIRTETAAEALAIDGRILAAWEGHKARYVIDSAADFRTKMASALDIIEQLVPTCCRQHLEVLRISRP